MKYVLTSLLICLSFSIYAQQAPQVKEQEKKTIISKMKEYKEVQEALIMEQEDINKLSLALIVSKETSRERARQLGDQFLSNAMTHFDAENKENTNCEKIGKSTFDYMVSVCTSKKVIIMGTKVPGDESITW